MKRPTVYCQLRHTHQQHNAEPQAKWPGTGVQPAAMELGRGGRCEVKVSPLSVPI